MCVAYNGTLLYSQRAHTVIAYFPAPMLQAFPASNMNDLIAESDPYVWAAESNAWAANFTYTAPQAPEPLPADYAPAAQQVCKRQVALAGYRLASAAALNSALSTTETAGRDRATALRGAAHSFGRARFGNRN